MYAFDPATQQTVQTTPAEVLQNGYTDVRKPGAKEIQDDTMLNNRLTDVATKLKAYEAEAVKIQDLYLAGKKAEAMAAVPNQLVDAIALVGPRERIRDRVEAWKAHQVPTLLIGSGQPEALRLLAELCL